MAEVKPSTSQSAELERLRKELLRLIVKNEMRRVLALRY